MQKRERIAVQELCGLEESDTRCEALEEIRFRGLVLYRGVMLENRTRGKVETLVGSGGVCKFQA